MLKAKDIMNRDVVTVSPETTVEELGGIFTEKKISGAPVVDSSGALVGIVTENDLIRRDSRFHIPTFIRIFDAIIPIGESAAVEEIKRMSASKAGDICTRKVITVEPEATMQDIATIMTEKGVHLLPVLDSGKLVGIIGKIDVIKGTMGEAEERRP